MAVSEATIGDDVAGLNDKDKDFIREQINAGWWKQFVLPIGAVVTIAIFLVVQYGDYREFKSNVNSRLDGIEKSVASLQLQTHSALPPESFQAALPELKTALTTAKKGNVRLPPTVVDELQQRFLSSDPKAPGYWPAVAEFINYRSSLAKSGPPIKSALLVNTGSTEMLPKCIDQLPHGATLAQDVSPGAQTFQINAAHSDNCSFQLDSAEEDAIITAFARSYPALTLRNCLVIYNGGPVELHLGMWPLMFQNCRWEINVSGAPPDSGQKVTQTLLAGNAESFKLPSL